MRKVACSILFTLFLKTTFLAGQTPFFEPYYPLKKNQPVQVNSLVQDRKGFVWFGTNQGLFRFDGLHYRHYAEADSLPASGITALAEDSAGRIWMGHQDGQLSYLEDGNVHIFETREGSAVEPVSDILFDRNGNMWFSTKNDGLYYYVKGRLFRVDQEEGLPDLFIYDLFEDPEGNIWAGTDGGIAVCSLGDRKINITVINSDDGLTDLIVKKIKMIHADTLGLATEDGGILTYSFKTKQIQPLLESPWNYGAITDFVVKENQIWIAAPTQGLVVTDLYSQQTKLYSAYDRRSLLSVNTLMKDQEGNIWSGSKNGLTRTLGDAVEYLENLDPVRDINTLAVAVDGRDRIWFSTNEGLFVRSYSRNGSAVIAEKLQDTQFREAVVISLYADEKGFVWAGLYGNGLLRIDPETNQVKHFQKELRNGNILGITGKGDKIWVATLGGSSSIQIDHNQFVVTNYSSADGLSSDFIYQVFIDSKDRTWFATDGKGVSMLDQKGFHHYEEGLPSRVIYNFAEDVNNNIWVTSQDNGVYLFESGKFVSVPEFKLRDNSIQSLVSDHHGNLIALHNFGIDVYNVNTKRMRHWGEETGIRSKHPNLNAVGRDQYGQFFIGTSRGIVKFSLRNDRTNSSPQPEIDALRVFDEVIDISDAPTLKYNENNVTVQFLGFWYQNTQNLNYLYKLENYDEEWISTRNREVTYSRLPPGEYTFKVKVSDTDDFSLTQETSASFSIRPPFWKTAPFYLFILGLFVISAYGLIKFRERKLLEDKLILEARVEERTREIQQKTEEIQAQNEEIMAQAEEIQGINENLEMLVKQRTAELEKKNKALEEYAFINAHKLRSPVASILGLLNLLAKTETKDDTKVIGEHLQQSAEKLDAVVRSITQAIEKADNKYL